MKQTNALFNNQRNNTTLLPQFQKQNLTRDQREALNQLAWNKELTIKSADKGGAVVVMDTSLYIQEANRQLSNNKYYKEITEPITSSIIPQITDILYRLHESSYINSKQLDFLLPRNSQDERYFYLLPKIHKPRKSWPHPYMPPGRPIISDTNSPTYQISRYIDHYLRPLASQHESYIKDTYDFVNKIRNRQIPSHALLITADVTSLYTNMHHERIIDTVRDKFLHNPNPKRPDNDLLELLGILLKNNDFTFNNKTYLQIIGAAMGFPISPSCADIYLEFLDKQICDKYRDFIPFYFRFLDDIIMAWTGNTEQLTEFTAFANSLIPDITLTLEVKHYCISFLDTIIYKSPTSHIDNHCSIRTKVYFKPTDTHQLLHKTSNHPKHTTNGILKSQLIRFKRLSSTFTQYNTACNLLWGSLRHRGYSASKFRKLKRDTYNNFKPITNPTNNIHSSHIFPIITHYDNISQQLNRYIRSQLKDNEVFENVTMVSAYKNHKSFKNILTSGKISHPRTDFIKHTGTINTCNHPKCACCKHLDTNLTYTNSSSTKRFHISRNFHCNSTNIIYLIKCKICNKLYVGLTERQLKDRLNNHRSNIQTKKDTPIARHFIMHGIDNLLIKPIFQLQTNTTYKNKLKTEATFIKTLKTFQPHGLNHIKTSAYDFSTHTHNTTSNE